MLRFVFGLLLVVSLSFGLKPLYLPLEGNYSEIFFWYSQISVGGAAFTVTIDTGSSDLLIPQLGCGSCFGGDPNHYYNISGHTVPCNTVLQCSCNTKTQSCNFNVTYGGSLTEYAAAVTDDISLGEGWVAYGALFGATYNVTMQQQQQQMMLHHRRRSFLSHRRTRQSMPSYPEGIWGLAFSSLNSLGTLTLLDTICAQQHSTNVFSTCFEQVGGLLVVGEEPSSWGPWQHVAVSPKEGFWQVGFKTVTLNGVDMGFPSHIYNTPGIVDSGTPFFTLPTPVYNAIKSKLLANCTKNPLVGVCGSGISPVNGTIFDGNCFSMTDSQRDMYPTFEVIFDGGAKLQITPEMYVMPLYACNVPGQYGLGLVPDPSFTVIGGNVLIYYAASFDKLKLQVGFARSNGECKK